MFLLCSEIHSGQVIKYLMRECCKFSLSTSKLGCMSYIVVSPGYKSFEKTFSDKVNGKSLMKIKNNSGPNTGGHQT